MRSTSICCGLPNGGPPTVQVLNMVTDLTDSSFYLYMPAICIPWTCVVGYSSTLLSQHA